MSSLIGSPDLIGNGQDLGSRQARTQSAIHDAKFEAIASDFFGLGVVSTNANASKYTSL